MLNVIPLEGGWSSLPPELWHLIGNFLKDSMTKSTRDIRHLVFSCRPLYYSLAPSFIYKEITYNSQLFQYLIDRNWLDQVQRITVKVDKIFRMWIPENVTLLPSCRLQRITLVHTAEEFSGDDGSMSYLSNLSLSSNPYPVEDSGVTETLCFLTSLLKMFQTTRSNHITLELCIKSRERDFLTQERQIIKTFSSFWIPLLESLVQEIPDHGWSFRLSLELPGFSVHERVMGSCSSFQSQRSSLSSSNMYFKSARSGIGLSSISGGVDDIIETFVERLSGLIGSCSTLIPCKLNDRVTFSLRRWSPSWHRRLQRIAPALTDLELAIATSFHPRSMQYLLDAELVHQDNNDEISCNCNNLDNLMIFENLKKLEIRMHPSWLDNVFGRDNGVLFGLRELTIGPFTGYGQYIDCRTLMHGLQSLNQETGKSLDKLTIIDCRLELVGSDQASLTQCQVDTVFHPITITDISLQSVVFMDDNVFQLFCQRFVCGQADFISFADVSVISLYNGTNNNAYYYSPSPSIAVNEQSAGWHTITLSYSGSASTPYENNSFLINSVLKMASPTCQKLILNGVDLSTAIYDKSLRSGLSLLCGTLVKVSVFRSCVPRTLLKTELEKIFSVTRFDIEIIINT